MTRLESIEDRLNRLEARLTALEAPKQETLYYRNPPPGTPGTSWQCGVCKTWVPLGQTHECAGAAPQ